MKLDPERYQCPEHAVDVTGQVSDVLDDVGPPLTCKGRRRAGPAPFQVIVTCPGKGGAGEHSLTCAGTRTR